MTMHRSARIFVAGARGLVGSAIVRRLQEEAFENILMPSSMELDLCDREATLDYFRRERPDYVFIAAAKVGGIWANQNYPVDFCTTNLRIELNVMEASFAAGVTKLLFLGSSCIYPKHSEIPIRESSLLTGSLEPTNEGYALSKIVGIRLCEYYRRQFGCNFISAMPTNTFGLNDNFDPVMGHMLPSLIYKFHRAKRNQEANVTVWGTGKPRREMIFVDDVADALVFLMKHYNEGELINVGTGEDLAISEIADVVKKVVGFSGDLVFDHSKPDGVFRKVMNVDKIKALGWKPRYSFEEAVRRTYDWYQDHYEDHKSVKIHPSYHKAPLIFRNRQLADWIKFKMIDPILMNKSLDDPQIPELHRAVILRKSFLKKTYLHHYAPIVELEKGLSQTLPSLELGSGGGFLKRLLPDLITSDVHPVPGVDRVENAYKLSFADQSLKAIYLVGVLHHFGDVRAFFREARRTLCKGGYIVMMEPHMSSFGQFFFKKLHHEGNDMNSQKWEFPQAGPLSSANTALPYLIFDRDLSRFQREFPDLVIQSRKYHTFVMYGLSGGVSLRWSMPGFMFSFVQAFEWLLSPWMKKYFGTMQTVTIRKNL